MEMTREAFEQVVTPLYGNFLLLATKWCFGDRCKAEDALQDALLKAYSHLDQFKGDKFESWLHSILKNTILTINHPKKHGWASGPNGAVGKDLKEVIISEDFQAASKVPTPLDILCNNDDAQFLQTLMQNLPERDRQIMQDDADGIPQAEIAKRNNITRGTVGTCLYRTRKILREQLREHN